MYEMIIITNPDCSRIVGLANPDTVFLLKTRMAVMIKIETRRRLRAIISGRLNKRHDMRNRLTTINVRIKCRANFSSSGTSV
jgi:hypothetical protein